MKECEGIRKDKKLGVGFEWPEGFTKYVYGNTIDELIDGLELLKDGKFINYFVWKFPDLSEEQLERLDVIMPKTNCANEICKYACNRKRVCNTTEFEDALIRLKSLCRITEFAANYKGADIQKLEEVVLKSKDSDWIYNFSKEVEKANISKLKKAIFELNKTQHDAFNIAMFCCKHQDKQDIIRQEDVEMAEKIVISSKYAIAIETFAINVKGANIDKLREAIIKTESEYYINEFIKKFGTGKKLNFLQKIKNKLF